MAAVRSPGNLAQARKRLDEVADGPTRSRHTGGEMARAASSKTGGPEAVSSRRTQAPSKGAIRSSPAKSKSTTGGEGSRPRSRAARSQTPIETNKDANVLASGKAASSPASARSGRKQQRSAGGCLRAAAGGSGRALALRCARRPRASADDGRTDASGGDSELRMASADSTAKPRSKPDAPTSSDTESTTRKRVLRPARDDCRKVADLPQRLQTAQAPRRVPRRN